MGRVFFFLHSLRLTGIRRLELARSTRQYLREILTPALPRSAPTPYDGLHMRMVSFFDAYATMTDSLRGASFGLRLGRISLRIHLSTVFERSSCGEPLSAHRAHSSSVLTLQKRAHPSTGTTCARSRPSTLAHDERVCCGRFLALTLSSALALD